MHEGEGAKVNRQQVDNPANILPGRWVRLYTLVILRWAAILGQIAAIIVSITVFSLQFQYGSSSDRHWACGDRKPRLARHISEECAPGRTTSNGHVAV